MPIIKLQGEQDRRDNISYEVDTDSAPLGVGGMGQVYKGTRIDHNTGSQQPVAIKFLFDDLSQGIIERARREASIQINSENLVKMYGFIEVEGPGGVMHYHVVSELLEGVMLADLLNGKTADNNGKTIPYAQELHNRMQSDREGFAAIVVKSVLSGIMAMHDKHYIHRDIDPSNIMVTVDGNVKLIDYGIAKQIKTINTQDKALTSTGQFMGKAAYAAPELVTGDVPHQNETTDIYAIGIMLYQLLTGKLPFEGADHEVLQMQMKGKPNFNLIPNKELRKVVDKAMAKKQADRYMSAAEFRVDLERNERHLKTNPGSPAIALPSVAAGKNKVIGLVAGAAILAAAVGGFLLFKSNGDEETMAPMTSEAIEGQSEKVAQAPEYEIAFDDAIKKLDASATVAEGIEDLKRIANAGNSKSLDAALQLRKIYYDGRTVAEDNPASFHWAKQAYKIDPENAEVIYWMAEAYLAGPGVAGTVVDSRNPTKALELYQEALERAKSTGNNKIAEDASKRIGELNVVLNSGAGAEF
ncbi:MAG: protein kinase [Pseudoflavonifractor sp.]|nr:protein kinase [Alloprevotella sp.]MCM1116865.1 protein kinase [Pseudoflavonifractor sp.]